MFVLHLKTLSFLMTILLCSTTFGQTRFYVNIKGMASQIESVKKRSEYRMSKNVDYCRGVKMPKPSAGWLCKKLNNNQVACSRQYECTFVDRNFNRKSESLRTYQAMKALPALSSSYSIALSSKPKFAAKATTRPIVAKQVVKPKAKLTPQQIKVEATPAPVATPEVSLEDDLFAELEEPAVEEQQPQKTEDDVFEDAFAEEKPVVEDAQKEDDTGPSISQWSFLRFDLSLTQTSDETGSQSALEGGWRPRWIFSKNWSLEARLGFSQRRAVADSTEEAFSVMETAIFLNRHLGNWRLTGGLGRQSWGGEAPLGDQAPTFFALGATYLWSDTKFLGVEGVEFKYISLSDEASSTALRFGLLFRF